MSLLLLPHTACPCCVARMPLEPPPPLAVQWTSARERAQARPRFDMPQSGPLLLAGGTVVDPRDGSLRSNVDVYVDKGRVVAVGPAGTTRASSHAQRIDASGKYIVPGYNDMHTHVLELKDPSGSFALMLAEGVTGVRQMSGSPDLIEQRKSNTLPLQKEGPALLELPGSLLTPMNATSAETVGAEIVAQKEQGADFVKAGVMSAEVFRAALQAAKKAGIKILGHLQDGVAAAEASDAGFKTIEHLGPGATVWIGCSTDEAQLAAENTGMRLFKRPPPKFLHWLIKLRLQTLLINPAAFIPVEYVARLQRALDSYDEVKARALAQRFASNGTWHCPTLVRLRTQELADDSEYEHSDYLRYMPKKAIAKWRSVTKRFTKLPVAARETYRRAYPRQLALTKMLADNGVKMMTGSDGGWLSNPGLTLQEEFVELNKAGLSPLQILQMTTINAAEYLGRTATMGTVEAGRNADLVLLDKNPLESVSHLNAIAGVVRAGFHYARKDLDALKERVAQARGVLR